MKRQILAVLLSGFVVSTAFGMQEAKELKSVQAEVAAASEVALVLEPNNKKYAWVINSKKNTLTAVDAEHSSEIIATVATGKEPVALALQGRYLFVVNKKGRSLQVFDVVNVTPYLIGTIAISKNPKSVAVNERLVDIIFENGDQETFDVSTPARPVQV